MTWAPHSDPTAALMQAGNALVLDGPDNKPADRIIDFRSGEVRRASESAAQSTSSSPTAIEADATTLVLFAQCVP
jgi:hypothetical protein